MLVGGWPLILAGAAISGARLVGPSPAETAPAQAGRRCPVPAEADFTAMAQDVSVLTISQSGDDAEDDYTQEECTEAAQ